MTQISRHAAQQPGRSCVEVQEQQDHILPTCTAPKLENLSFSLCYPPSAASKTHAQPRECPCVNTKYVRASFWHMSVKQSNIVSVMTSDPPVTLQPPLAQLRVGVRRLWFSSFASCCRLSWMKECTVAVPLRMGAITRHVLLCSSSLIIIIIIIVIIYFIQMFVLLF